jgi:hypothetical protein
MAVVAAMAARQVELVAVLREVQEEMMVAAGKGVMRVTAVRAAEAREAVRGVVMEVATAAARVEGEMAVVAAPVNRVDPQAAQMAAAGSLTERM